MKLNHNIFKGLLLGAFSLLFTFPLFAKHYGAAGCGLGSMLISSNSKGSQVTAATTNDSSSKGSAITSGTSGCTGESVKSASIQFIEINKYALANDVARGGGEVLSGLLELNDCKFNNQEAAQILQKNFSKIFPSQQTQSHEIYENLNQYLVQRNLCHFMG
jgi:hypothetical protein